MDRKRLYTRLGLVALFALIFGYSLFGEKLPFNDGLGWDGDDFFKMIKGFSTIYFNHEIDAYDIQRVLPFAILHYAFMLFSIDVTASSAVIGACVLNSICMCIAIAYFFKISNNQKWNVDAESIAFAICFFNVPVLKVFGYYPLLTDCPAYLLSIMAIYYYLSDNRIMGTLVGVLSMVTWPILSLVILILFFFPRTVIEKSGQDDNKDLWLHRFVTFGYTIWIPLLFFMFSVFYLHLHPDKNFVDLYSHRLPLNFVHAVICIVTTAVFYFYISKTLFVKWLSIVKTILKWKNLKPIILSGIGFTLIYKLSKIYGGADSFSPLGQLFVFQEYASSDIFIYLETHFLYLGLFFLLIILNWKNIIDTVCNQYGISYFLIIMMAMLFIMDIETRKLVSFYPILLVPLMSILNRKKLKRFVPYVFVCLCLIMSFFWWQINVPGIEESFIARIENYRVGPAQRYFMFMGPWQSRQVYIIVSIVELLFLSLIYWGHKKKIFYKTEQE